MEIVNFSRKFNKKHVSKAPFTGMMRTVFIVSAVVLVSACQTAFDVVPKTEIAALNSAAAKPAISVSGAEAFDRQVNPVTFICGVADFNMKFAEGAEELIKSRLHEQLGDAKRAKYSAIDVEVTDSMIRMMTIAVPTYSMRFDVETRIALSASATSTTGAVSQETVSNQWIELGVSSNSDVTCVKGKDELEKFVPMMLERTVDKLAAKL